jgi:DNA-binding XRE family transcriptional regulator
VEYHQWLLLSKARKLHDLEKVMAQDEFEKLKHLLALNVRQLRKEKGIAQERLGLEAGVDRTVISKIEREIANPSLDILTRIATFLSVNLVDLFKAPKNK